jgi:ferredoxin
MSAVLAPAAAPIVFELDGRPVSAQPGESILQAAERAGVAISHLCHRDGLRADGNCRACVVEIAGERTLAPSCCRALSATTPTWCWRSMATRPAAGPPTARCRPASLPV